MNDPKIHIVTEKEFSDLANQVMYATFKVYSSRKRVNVIFEGRGLRGEGNHFFPRAHGNVRDAVEKRIREVMVNHGNNGDEFALGEVFGSDGEYHATLWREKHSLSQHPYWRNCGMCE